MTDHDLDRRLLVAAAEESFLWEVPWPVITWTNDVTRIEPRVPQTEIAGALTEAIDQGLIELAEVGIDDSGLSAAEALKVSQDSRYWDFETAPEKLVLLLTEAGRRRLFELTSSDS